tara:strand:- start:462 stop:1097 length:636 start_codon:yes stop_codon:yes gene_type:complete
MNWLKNKINNFSKSKKLNITNLLDYVDLLDQNDIIIDCGANIGSIIHPFINIGCKIIAFEPNPYAYRKLEDKYQNNENITCFQKAVSIKNGQEKLFFHENSNDDELFWSTGSSLIESKKNVLNEKFCMVETINFSEFIKALNQSIKIVKMDIEGAEIDIINKLLDDGSYKLIDKLFVETHENKIPCLLNPTINLKKRIKKMGIQNIHLNWI